MFITNDNHARVIFSYAIYSLMILHVCSSNCNIINVKRKIIVPVFVKVMCYLKC